MEININVRTYNLQLSVAKVDQTGCKEKGRTETYIFF